MSSRQCYDFGRVSGTNQVRTFRLSLVALLLMFVSAGQPTRAQSIGFGLFERYLDPLRVQAGIPGLAAAIVHNGRIVWDRGFGSADIERSIAVQADTPFYIADLSQTLGATLLMQRFERGDFLLDDPIAQWTTQVPGAGVTVRHVLTHTTTGTFRYDPDRFSALTSVIESYTKEPYRLTVARDLLTAPAHVPRLPLRLEIATRAPHLLVQLRQCAIRGRELALHRTHTRRRRAVRGLALEILHRLAPRLLPVIEHGTKLIPPGAGG